nr:fimbrial protein [Acinetobacter sp. Marseille-Q1620]
MGFVSKIVALITLLLSMLVPVTHATCRKSSPNYIYAGDSYAAPLNFGKINMTTTYLQPVGSILGSIIVPPSSYSYNGGNADSILWVCDEADLPNIYFLAATNGDEPFGGHVETGLQDGLSGVYATWWKYIGLKQTMSGVVLSRYWQKIPITSYEKLNGKINIRLRDVPPLEAVLYRISQLPNFSRGSYCNTAMIVSGSYSSGKTANGATISCNQPSAYIQLSGDKTVTFSGINRDYEGEDSNVNFSFWTANGIIYGLNTSNTTLTNTPTCVARNATPLVNFAPISKTELENGSKVPAVFNVEIECSDSMISGTGTNQTAIGFQVSDGAYQAASNLGFVSSTNGSVSYLLSDEYGINSDIATGVAIKLYNAASNKEMVFLNQFGIAGGGEAAGWYPVLQGTPYLVGSAASGYTSYLQHYRAELIALPGMNITSGKVKATATVLVKVQ